MARTLGTLTALPSGEVGVILVLDPPPQNFWHSKQTQVRQWLALGIGLRFLAHPEKEPLHSPCRAGNRKVSGWPAGKSELSRSTDQNGSGFCHITHAMMHREVATEPGFKIKYVGCKFAAPLVHQSQSSAICKGGILHLHRTAISALQVHK